MIEFLADLLLAAKAIKEYGVALYLGMRNFNGHLAAGAQIRATKNSCHIGAGNSTFDAVVVECVARIDGFHHSTFCAAMPLSNASAAKTNLPPPPPRLA